MRIALIKDNQVVNVIEASQKFADTLGYDLALESAVASIGDTYDAGEFIRRVDHKGNARKEIAAIEQQTGMPRALRESLVAIEKAVGLADTYLQAQDAKAAVLREKLK